MTELKEMPSSLNDACRKLDMAYAEIERFRALLMRSTKLLAGDEFCLNDQIALIDEINAALNVQQKEGDPTKRENGT